MSYISLVSLAVTMAPVVILGAICVLSSVEASVREQIGQ